VIGIFNNQVPGERAYQTSIPMGSILHDRFFTFYSNSGGFVASLVLVAAVSQTVTLIARQELTGSELCRST